VFEAFGGDTAGRLEDAIGCDVGIYLEMVEFSAAGEFVGQLTLG
jgi:hypothetical protein